jgi:pimeloyl-ACP methyl ester carboxylesterase
VSTFVLLPGAGGASAYWRLVVPLLEAAGHRAIAVDFPGSDPHAGLSAYADRAVAAIGDERDVVLVAQSMGGFTAPLVCERVSVRALVFVNAMIPKPGETAGAWWGNTGSETARSDAARAHGYSPKFDLDTYFLHDLPSDVATALMNDARPEVEIAFTEPCNFTRWPDVPIHVIVARGDRFFPAEFQARVARERLGKEVETIAGGHLVALSNPRELTELLLAIP